MLVKDVMTPAPVCCKVDDTLDRVAKLMVDHDCGAIPVCDAMRPVGMITDRDITCRAVATSVVPSALPVNLIMTEKVYTVRQDEDVEVAIDRMKSKQVRRLPVVNDEGVIVGIVSPSDLAPTLASHNVADFLLAVSYWSRRVAPHAA